MLRAAMLRALPLVIAFAACGGPVLHEVRLVNQSPRTIAEVYLFPLGSANRGPSRGSLAPNATLAVKIRAGNVEIVAISEKVRVNQTESETKQASSTIQLVRPVSLIFHDSDQPAPPFEDKSAIGVTFRNTKEPEPAPEPEGEPVP
jgi:hypothetical protein